MKSEILCPVCSSPMNLSDAVSRRSKRPKVFLMLRCPRDGKHFRGFIADSGFVSRFIESAERFKSLPEGEPAR